MFKVNERVVYPGHGVARVENINEKIVSGTTMTFYKLNFLYKDMTILVPTHSLKSIGVRYLSEQSLVTKILDSLKKEPHNPLDHLDLSPSGWNKRNRDYHNLIESGFLIDLLAIYKDLMHISLSKELSFGEKNLLQSTEELIVQEIVEVVARDKNEILQELRAPFKQLMIHSEFESQGPTSSL